MTRFTVGMLTCVLFLALGASARGQGVVPGGWEPQFGFQTFGGPGYSGVAFSAGVSPFGGGVGLGVPGGNPFVPGMNPTATFPVSPAFAGGSGARLSPPVNQTANAVNPLIHAIRHSTKKRRGR